MGYIFCKYFLPICSLSSHFLGIAFLRAKIFHFNEGQLVRYFFSQIVLVVLYPKSYCLTQGCLGFLPCHFLGGLYFFLQEVLHLKKFFSSRFYIAHEPFGINFCGVNRSISRFIACGCPIILATIVAVFVTLCSLCKNQLTILIWVYFWTLCSIYLFVCSSLNTTPFLLLQLYSKS